MWTLWICIRIYPFKKSIIKKGKRQSAIVASAFWSLFKNHPWTKLSVCLGVGCEWGGMSESVHWHRSRCQYVGRTRYVLRDIGKGMKLCLMHPIYFGNFIQFLSPYQAPLGLKEKPCYKSYFNWVKTWKVRKCRQWIL